MRTIEIHSDGACSGNPGPAGVGCVLSEDGAEVQTVSQYIGEATNNIAEYMALIYGLQAALICRADRVVAKSDSELMCRQIQGLYQVKNPQIKVLFDQVQHLISGFRSFSIEHVVREHNKAADRLARQAIKHGQTQMLASAMNAGEESPSSGG